MYPLRFNASRDDRSISFVNEGSRVRLIIRLRRRLQPRALDLSAINSARRDGLSGVNDRALGEQIRNVTLNVITRINVAQNGIKRVTTAVRNYLRVAPLSDRLGDFNSVVLGLQGQNGVAIGRVLYLTAQCTRALEGSRDQGTMCSARVHDLNVSTRF